MAEIPVEQRDVKPTDPMPVWAALLGLSAIIGLVCLLFAMGASSAPRTEDIVALALHIVQAA